MNKDTRRQAAAEDDPSNWYDASGKARIMTPEDLIGIPKPNYVYVLCEPGSGLRFKPFYVGLGQGNRLFAHEDEARKGERNSSKIQAIRAIWNRGGEVVRFIDGCYDDEPWHEEQELIDRFGLRSNGTGILTNRNRYAESCVEDGAELRKYKDDRKNFIRRYTRLESGPRRPASRASVYGKIVAALDKHPGVTGEKLVELLLDVDFSGNKSAYTQTGQVSRSWLEGYIDGGFYKKNECIREFRG